MTTNNLALAYTELGNTDKAIEYYNILIELEENELGADAYDTLSSVNSLGLAYYNIGDYPVAKLLFARAAEGFEKTLGKEHADTVQLLQNLAAAENQIN